MANFTARSWSIIAFLALVVAANYLTSTLGLISVGIGLLATAGTWAAGLVLLARDLVQETSGRLAVFLCILAGAGLSAATSSPRLAIASGTAFAISETADFAVYTPLRRKGWARAALASNLVGSLVDSVAFLTLAGFPIWQALPGQMLAKTTATIAVILPVVVARAVLRNRLRPEGA